MSINELRAQTDYENLSDNFKLVANGTAGTEIKLVTKTQVYSYTPTATGSVTFSRYNGQMLVFEGETLKGYISAAENPVTYADITANADGTVANSLLADGSFYNHTSATLADSKWSLGEAWTTNVTQAAMGIRVGTLASATDGIVLVWRGSGNSNYFSQKLTNVIKPNTPYKFVTSQVAGSNANADFNVGLGASVGALDYCYKSVKLGSDKNGVKTAFFTSPATVAEDVYFSFKNTSSNTASSGSDPVAQLDYVALVEGTPEITPGLTGATEVSYAAGEYLLPSTPWNGDFESSTALTADATWSDATTTFDATAGWTGVRHGWSGMGVLAYSSAQKLNGQTVPARDGATGNVFAICASYTGNYAYISQDIYLEKGSYKLSYDIAAAIGGDKISAPAGTNTSGVYVNGSNLAGGVVLPETAGTWETQEYEIYMAADGVAEVRISYNANKDGGSDYQSRVFFDNVKIEKVEGTVLNDGDDMTAKITNPSFETGDGTGWDFNTASDTGVKPNSNATYTTGDVDGSYLFNTWGGTAEKYVKQTLAGLPEGYYVLKALVASDENNKVKLYAGDKENEYITTSKGIFNQVVTPHVEVTDGTLEIGAKSTDWYKVDNFQLYYYITEDEAVKASEKVVAQNILNHPTYVNVTGVERTALSTAISGTNGVDDIETLNVAVATFKSAKADYDSYAETKTFAQIIAAAEYPYAATSKKTALEATYVTAPTTAAAAAAAVAPIVNAYRAYVESNGMAEGVAGAVDMTSRVLNNCFEDGLNNWTSAVPGGNLGVLSGESFTDANGKNDYKYYDYWNGDSNCQDAYQIVTLPAGKYILTATARADMNLNKVELYAGAAATELNKIGNTGGVFNRGWNDITVEFEHTGGEVRIGYRTTDAPSKKSGWFGFTRVRLVKIADVKATVDYTFGGEYGTIILPFAAEKPAGMEVYSCEATESNGATLTLVPQESLAANTPYIVKKTGDTKEFSFTGVSVREKDTYDAGWLTGVFVAQKAPTNSYVLQTQNDVQAFYHAVEGKEPTMSVNRAYLTVPEGANAPKCLRFEEGATAISNINAEENTNVIYDIQGRRVNNVSKHGIYIVNGKKTVK